VIVDRQPKHRKESKSFQKYRLWRYWRRSWQVAAISDGRPTLMFEFSSLISGFSFEAKWDCLIVK
jgi:hypothetical protein